MKATPYASNKGVRIHYEVEGDGAPLVLLHWFSETCEIWHVSGYVKSLKKECRLILVDARGHGDSDKPHDSEAYTMRLMVSDVIAVLNSLNVSKVHFLGYSMGGWIGFGIAKYNPQRFYSLIIGGMHPYARPNQPMVEKFTTYQSTFANDSPDTGAKLALVEEWLGPTAAKMPGWRAYAQRVLPANDWKALIALLSGDWRRGFEDVLPTITMPVLLFVGETDAFYSGVRKCAESIPNATFISFPGLGHTDIEAKEDLVLPHITKFLEKVNHSMKC